MKGRTKYFQKLATGDDQATKIQANVERALSPILKCPILDGREIEDVALTAGSNKIEHKLGRKVRGFFNGGQSNGATISVVAKDENYLTLSASANVTVSLWVY